MRPKKLRIWDCISKGQMNEMALVCRIYIMTKHIINIYISFFFFFFLLANHIIFKSDINDTIIL
jgi:hypothetical protein